MNINIKLINSIAIMPTRGSTDAAGYDLYTYESGDVNPNETVKFHTGISMEIPKGFVGLVFARSGLGINHGIVPSNCVGVIDSDYRGEIMVALHNHSNETYSVKENERVAQIVIVPFLSVEFKKVTELTNTERGVRGFGSTGKK